MQNLIKTVPLHRRTCRSRMWWLPE